MNMASEDAPQCIIHQDNAANEEVKRFTSVRWDKWRESVNKWLVLDGHERRLAESAGGRTNFDHGPIIPGVPARED